MLTSPGSTLSTTIFKWLNLTRQFESFMPYCFTHFVNMAISGSKYFHEIYAKHGGIFNNHFIANFLDNQPMKIFKNQLRFDSYYHEFGVSLFIETWCINLSLYVLNFF